MSADSDNEEIAMIHQNLLTPPPIGPRRRRRDDGGSGRGHYQLLQNPTYETTTNNYFETSEGHATYNNEIEETKEEHEGKSSANEHFCPLLAGPQHRQSVNKGTPWKVISYHTGTSNDHYHLIYVSSAKAWGYNSKLGKIIKAAYHRCIKITCITCLLEYLSPDDGRITLRNILTANDQRICICVAHSLGICGRAGQATNAIGNTSTQGRNLL